MSGVFCASIPLYGFYYFNLLVVPFKLFFMPQDEAQAEAGIGVDGTLSVSDEAGNCFVRFFFAMLARNHC